MNSNVMTNGTFEISLRRAAIIAGCALILMAVAAGFSYGFVMTSLIVSGEAATTFRNIQASESLFRGGIGGFLFVLLCDIVVTWALYIFLKPVNKNLSLLAAWFRLVYSAMLGAALLLLVIAARLVHGSDYLAASGAVQVQAQTMLFLNGFNDLWAMSLVVFGCHLLVLGYAVFLSGSMPKILGVLLFVAGLCYVGSNFAHVLLPNYDNYKANVDMVLSLPEALGELGFGIWLLLRGGKKDALTS